MEPLKAKKKISTELSLTKLHSQAQLYHEKKSLEKENNSKDIFSNTKSFIIENDEKAYENKEGNQILQAFLDLEAT